MPKRSYTDSSYAVRKRSKYNYPRRIPRGPRAGSSVIVKRTVFWDVTSGAADFNGGFGFSPTNLWRDGASSTAIDGASDMTNLFDMCRIKKVECIVTPYGNVHEFANDSTTIKALPVIYIAADKTDGYNPNASSIMQFDNLHVTCLDHVVRYTCYPRLTTGSGYITLNRYAAWTNTGSDQPAYGIKMHVDWPQAQVTLTGFRINFIITYECKDAK